MTAALIMSKVNSRSFELSVWPLDHFQGFTVIVIVLSPFDHTGGFADAQRAGRPWEWSRSGA